MSDKCLKQNHYFIKFILLILPLIYSCSSESEKQLWHKGNLHTHSFWSDGDDFPEMIIKWYKDHEYQFIALSDHNTIADSDFWYKLTQKDIKNKVLDQYIDSLMFHLFSSAYKKWIGFGCVSMRMCVWGSTIS